MDRKTELIDFLSARFGKSSGFESEDDLRDLLANYCKASDAIMQSILFLPELILVNDSVLLRMAVPEEMEPRFLKAVAKGDKSRETLEASFNFVEIGYLFNPPGSDTTDEEDELLARIVRDAWDGWLRVSYPDRRFTVEVLPPEVTGSTVGVCFFENR